MHFLLFGLSRSSRVFFLVEATLIALAMAAAIVVGLDLREEARTQGERDTSRLALVLGEQSLHMLESTDLVLTGIDKDLGLARLATPEAFRAAIASQAVHLDLAARQSGLPQADGLAVFGADGQFINGSRNWPPPSISVADRAYFKVMQAADGPLRYVSEPVVSRATGNWTVFVLRRVAAPDGTFLGLLAAPVRVKYLEHSYAAINLQDGMAVTLLRRDGLVLIDSPVTRNLNTRIMPAASPWYPIVAGGGGDYWSPGWLDGQPSHVSVHPVPGFPVVVDVRLTRNAIYATWRRQVAVIAAATLVVCASLMLLLRALVAQFRRLETATATLRRKSILLETTLANIEQGLIMVTAERMVGVVNDRALKLLEISPALMHVGARVDDILEYQCARGEFANQEQDLRLLRGQAPIAGQPLVAERHRANGTVLEIHSTPFPGGGLVRTYTDVTQRLQAEQRIIHAALHDVLTDLPNRVLFAERLGEAIADLRNSGSRGAVLLLDLDRFKRVNDTLSHAAGDELLRQVAARMRSVAREAGTLARMGGDEFALVLPGADPETAMAIAWRLQTHMREPYSLPQGDASVPVSIGISCYPDHGGNPEALLHHADLALYRAKAAGRDMCCLFDEALDTHQHDELVLESALQFALQQEQFALVYQPIWDIRAQRIGGAEALVRWHHPVKGIIPPAEFIPLAERTGLIVELGRWVMQAACREAVNWAYPIGVSVNVTAAQLRRPELIGELRNLLAASGLPPTRLKLEITESQLLEETAGMLATMVALREMGVRLSLDDFGTGHASLSSLRSFPFTDAKIDRSFVQEIVHDERSRGLVESILQVCRVLNLDCVAEGVETPEQLTLLQNMGCTHAQGFLIGRPEPPVTIRQLLWNAAAEQRQDSAAAVAETATMTARTAGQRVANGPNGETAVP